MAGETAAQVTPPTGTTFMAGHAARASFPERIRQNTVIQFKRRYIELGGSDQIGSESTTYERAVQAPEVELCEEDFRGLTVDLVVWVRVNDPAGTVRMQLYNTDDGSVVGEMAAAVSDTTLTRYVVTLTLPLGTVHKWCQLQIKTSAGYRAFGFGRLRIRL